MQSLKNIYLHISFARKSNTQSELGTIYSVSIYFTHYYMNKNSSAVCILTFEEI